MSLSDAQRRTEQAPASSWRAVLDLPGLNIAIFAFPLSFAWEVLQSGFFRGMTEDSHGDAVRLCTLATFGDVGIALDAFWGVGSVIGAAAGGMLVGVIPATLLKIALGTILNVSAVRIFHGKHASYGRDAATSLKQKG